MTTITHKDGIVAYDSRLTSGTSISSEVSKKRHLSRGVEFFMCGSTADHKQFIEAYFDGRSPRKELDVTAIIVASGSVYKAGAGDGELWVQPAANQCAIGSGRHNAITAMDMGATAKEAVKWAMKRDTGTGGRIRTFKV